MSADDLAAIAALGLPVLCFDSCTALDLLRDPTREEIRSHERKAAVALLRAAEQGWFVLLMADQVGRELAENLPSVEADAAKGLAKLRSQIERVQALDAVYAGTGQIELAHLDDHIDRARKIHDRWIACARPAREGSDIATRAFFRVMQGRTPASKGKESMKDCVVVETYLDAVAQLRSAGLSTPCVFASSNVRDYASVPGSALRPDLAQDFAAVGLAYAPNLAAAKSGLGM